MKIYEYISKFRSFRRRYGSGPALERSIEKFREILWIKKVSSQRGALTTKVNLLGTKIGMLIYRCNICGKYCKKKVAELMREESSCFNCGSSVRLRAIVHVLSIELFGESLAIQDFPKRPDIKGVGMSDWEGYAIPLSQKLGYTNTYYHKEPKLDITSVNSGLEGTLDFIISSDVFEHVPPPISRAFENARKLLKANGVLIFTAPYTLEENTREHFPDLYRYKIIKEGDGHILRNITRDGRTQTFDNLVFHGGPGATLEMRIFSESSLRESFARAGFTSITIYREPFFDYGIYWPHEWSLPIAARVK